MTVGTVIQLKAYVSRFIEYYRNLSPLLTTLVPLVVFGNSDHPWCHAEDIDITILTEDNFTVRVRSATKYATVFCPPTHCSVPAYEAK